MCPKGQSKQGRKERAKKGARDGGGNAQPQGESVVGGSTCGREESIRTKICFLSMEENLPEKACKKRGQEKKENKGEQTLFLGGIMSRTKEFA